MKSKPIIIDEDLLEFDLDFGDNSYDYNGISVPRVTNILSSCTDQKGLISWAANVYPKEYHRVHNSSLRIGTMTHAKIDHFLSDLFGIKMPLIDEILDPFKNDYEERQAETALNNFIEWFESIKRMNYPIQEVIGLEVPVVCPWFGGTIDAIVKINNFYYIIDFKTSKQIVPEYIIQTSAYMWVINNYYQNIFPHINGIGIIRVDKKESGIFEDYFINELIPEQNCMIYNAQKCFCSMVDTYYRTLYSSNQYKDYQKVYKFSGTIRGK